MANANYADGTYTDQDGEPWNRIGGAWYPLTTNGEGFHGDAEMVDAGYTMTRSEGPTFPLYLDRSEYYVKVDESIYVHVSEYGTDGWEALNLDDSAERLGFVTVQQIVTLDREESSPA